jgi:hypothetical protein
LSILESSRHELHITHGPTFMTSSPHGWEAFPTPRALTHTRITWAFSPPAPQVPGVTSGSPLCSWCFGHPLWRGLRQLRCDSTIRLLEHGGVENSNMDPIKLHKEYPFRSSILESTYWKGQNYNHVWVKTMYRTKHTIILCLQNYVHNFTIRIRSWLCYNEFCFIG